MAVFVFFFRRKFRKSLPKGREIKHGIIAESRGPARRLRDLSVDAICHDCDRSSLTCQRDRANEISRTFLSPLTAQLAQQFFNSLRIARFRPGISRGVNSGRTAENRHHQAGIIGENQSFLKPGIMERLSYRIFSERWSILFERQRIGKTRQQV